MFARNLFGQKKIFHRFRVGILSIAVLFTISGLPGAIADQSTAAKEGSKMKKIESSLFGKTKEGNEVHAWTLTNANGLKATILDFGGVLYSMDVPDKNGKFENISANLATVPEYQENRPFFGSLVGRFGNRIANGKFKLDGKEYTLPQNNGPNSLHGGLKGFDQKIWSAEPAEDQHTVALRLKYRSQDGEEGYPGNLSATVQYILTDENELIIDYAASSDQPTPINLTNHTFWNLGGATSGSILDHEMLLGATHFLPTDSTLIPTGEILSVKDTPLDFTAKKTIGRDIRDIKEPQFNGGYDHCLILAPPGTADGKYRFCAYVRDPKSGRAMEIKTTEPAVQFYSGNFLNGSIGVGDYKYQKQTAFCLETQHYPDSPNHSNFPSTILVPNKIYRHTTIHRFTVEP